MSDGDACGAHCGHCGRCCNDGRTNTVCPACGNEYWREREDIGTLCDRCVANAHARAERTVEQREKPKPKVTVPAADVYEVNR